MKLCIDCRFGGIKTGLGRFTRELTPRLIDAMPDAEFVILARDNAEWLARDRAHVVTVDVPHYSLAEHRVLPAVIREQKADAFFSLHFNVPWRCPVPFAAVIHDMILHKFPNNAPAFKRAAYKVLLHRTVRKASGLLTISDYVRGELATSYGSPILKKTTTMHEGVSDIFRPADAAHIASVKATYGLPEKYFVYVGNAKQHKNVQMLIDAFARSGRTDCGLVLVTSGPEVERLQLRSGVMIVPSVAEADLPAVYAGAVACVTASLYEGCCLPVLEARHCGCPVIATDATAIPEVAGEAAFLCPPTVDAFASAFRKPPSVPGVLAERWTWERTAAEAATALRGAFRF